MSQPAPLTEQERCELIAFLDGELSGEQARAIEQRLSLDPRYRAEADTLRRTWELLDYLPRPEPNNAFTEMTLSRIGAELRPRPAVSPPWRMPALLSVGWVLTLLMCGWLGYAGYRWLWPARPGERELLRDLRLIENKRYYDLVEDLSFLDELSHPDLFGDESEI